MERVLWGINTEVWNKFRLCAETRGKHIQECVEEAILLALKPSDEEGFRSSHTFNHANNTSPSSTCKGILGDIADDIWIKAKQGASYENKNIREWLQDAINLYVSLHLENQHTPQNARLRYFDNLLAFYYLRDANLELPEDVANELDNRIFATYITNY